MSNVRAPFLKNNFKHIESDTFIIILLQYLERRYKSKTVKLMGSVMMIIGNVSILS